MEMMSGAAWVEQLQAGGWTVHAATFADRELKKRLGRRMHMIRLRTSAMNRAPTVC